MFDIMERIIRVFIMNEGKKQTFAFDLDAFVSYNVDTRELVLVNGSVFVHSDSEETVIKAYRLLNDVGVDMSAYYEEYDRLKAENDSLKRLVSENKKSGFLSKWIR